jgi:histidinol-phosphate aminotransferase
MLTSLLMLACLLVAALLLDVAAAHLVLAGLVLALLATTSMVLLTAVALLALLTSALLATALVSLAARLMLALLVSALLTNALASLATHLVLALLVSASLLSAMLTHLLVLARPPSSISAARGVSFLRLSFTLWTALVAALLAVATPAITFVSCHNLIPRTIRPPDFPYVYWAESDTTWRRAKTRDGRSEVSTLKADRRHVSHMQPRDLSAHAVYQAGRGIEEVARDLGLDPDDLVKLASNENPFGPSPAAVEGIRDAAGSANSYPKASHADLTEKLADRWSVAPEQVWLANGGDGVLDYIARAMLEPGDAVLVPDPGFAYYGMSARYHHGEVREYGVSKADDFALTADTVLDDYEGERVVYLTSPHNPTGKRFDLDTIETIADETGERTLVVVDEAYGEFADGASAVELLDGRDDVAVLRTFSKVYGLAGVRLGYGIVPEEWAEAYTRVSTPFAASEIACRAGLAALDDDDHAEKTVETAAWAREYVYENLDAPTWESHGNFVLTEVGNASEVADALQHRGVIVRDCTSFGLPECVRITCGTEDETKRAVAELNEVLAS